MTEEKLFPARFDYIPRRRIDDFNFSKFEGFVLFPHIEHQASRFDISLRRAVTEDCQVVGFPQLTSEDVPLALDEPICRIILVFDGIQQFRRTECPATAGGAILFL